MARLLATKKGTGITQPAKGATALANHYVSGSAQVSSPLQKMKSGLGSQKESIGRVDVSNDFSLPTPVTAGQEHARSLIKGREQYYNNYSNVGGQNNNKNATMYSNNLTTG